MIFATLSVLAHAGCADDAPTTLEAPELTVRAGRPIAATPAHVARIEGDGAVEAIGLGADGDVIVALDGQVAVLEDGALAVRRLYQEDDDPIALGRAHAISPRAEGGAWIAADHGLFELGAIYVSSARLPLGAVAAATEVHAGPLAGLWLAADRGLVHKGDRLLELYTIASLEGRPSHVAADAAGTHALVCGGGALAVIEEEDGALVSDRPPLDAGDVVALAGGRAQLWAAADGGVLRFDPARTPAWTRFTLADDGAPAARARAIAIDPTTGEAWARTTDAVVRIDGDTLTSFSVPPLADDATPVLAVDALGAVYTADGSAIVEITPEARETTVGFASDVHPWLVAHCTACHSNQTASFLDYQTFRAVADEALARVRDGDMPRCAGGLPCPLESRLLPSEYAVLESWIRAGRPE